MEKADPKIALVVCTKNRAGNLDSFFDAIRRLDCNGPWELIVVNGSTDDTDERLKAFASTFPGRITVITELQPGLGLARNRGWRQSTAPIMAFTDDDCYPDKFFLNDIQAVFADPSLGCAGGRILLYDPTDAMMTINESLEEKFLRAGDFPPAGFMQGANMAFRRQALVDINGFDDSLGAGKPFGAEDVDAAVRALAHGWTAKYDPRPVVYHHHRRKPGNDAMQLSRAYYVDRGGYYMKCILFMPQRWRCIKFWLWTARHQALGITLREVGGAIRYLFYQCGQKPNRSY